MKGALRGKRAFRARLLSRSGRLIPDDSYGDQTQLRDDAVLTTDEQAESRSRRANEVVPPSPSRSGPMPRRRDRLGTTRGRTSWSGRPPPDQPRSGSARPAKPHEDLRLAARPPLPQRQSECSVERRRQPRSCRSSEPAARWASRRVLAIPGKASALARRRLAPASGRKHRRGRAGLRRHEAGARPAAHSVAKAGVRVLVRDTLIAESRAGRRRLESRAYVGTADGCRLARRRAGSLGSARPPRPGRPEDDPTETPGRCLGP